MSNNSCSHLNTNSLIAFINFEPVQILTRVDESLCTKDLIMVNWEMTSTKWCRNNSLKTLVDHLSSIWDFYHKQVYHCQMFAHTYIWQHCPVSFIYLTLSMPPILDTIVNSLYKSRSLCPSTGERSSGVSTQRNITN